MKYGQNFLSHPVKSDMRIYESVCKIATGWGDNYRTGYLVDYSYFKDCYKMIAIDLSKQMLIQKHYSQLNSL